MQETGPGSTAKDDPYAGRRQLDRLTAEDLRTHPAWWFPGRDGHLSGPDEYTVMPLDSSAASGDGSADFSPGRYLLHAVFRFADGTEVDGHVSFCPGDHGDLPDREPTICTQWAQIALWHGIIVPSEKQQADDFSLLRKARDSVFPLTWRATLHPPGVELTGQLPGFAIYRDGEVAYV